MDLDAEIQNNILVCNHQPLLCLNNELKFLVECRMFQERSSKIDITGFGSPNRIYDAILPFRLLTLKITNKKVYQLVTLLMDHKENQSPSQQRRQLQIAELIRNVWNFGKDFSINEVKKVLGILSVNSFVVHEGSEPGLDLIGKLLSQQHKSTGCP